MTFGYCYLVSVSVWILGIGIGIDLHQGISIGMNLHQGISIGIGNRVSVEHLISTLMNYWHLGSVRGGGGGGGGGVATLGCLETQRQTLLSIKQKKSGKFELLVILVSHIQSAGDLRP